MTLLKRREVKLITELLEECLGVSHTGYGKEGYLVMIHFPDKTKINTDITELRGQLIEHDILFFHSDILDKSKRPVKSFNVFKL